MTIVLAITYQLSVLAYFFIALIVIWMLVWLAQRYRSVRLAGLASDLGLRLFVRDPLGIPQGYSQLQLFKWGHARRARNVLIGHWQGQRVRLFDYLYETGLGRDRQTQQFSVVIVSLNRDFPGLLVRPISADHSRYNLTGLEKVDSSQEDCRQGYEVFCEQAGFAEQSINGQILAKLRRCQNPTLEVGQGSLALYAPGKLKIAQYSQLRELTSELAEHFSPADEQQ